MLSRRNNHSPRVLKIAVFQTMEAEMRKTIAVRLMLILHLIAPTCLPALSQAADRDEVRFAAKQTSNSRTVLSEDQRIIHLLNRAGFGPRPNDVHKVRQMGVERYLELQLHPSMIDDSLAAAKLQSLRTLTISPAELLATYPRPRQNFNLKKQRQRGEGLGGNLEG